MDSLLCDELWLFSPVTAASDYSNQFNGTDSSSERCNGHSFCPANEDCEQALSSFLEKEASYMPQKGYLKHLQSKDLSFARFKAIQWLIKSRTRLNLSFVAFFNAANYLDRFLSMNHFPEWKNWMVELLSVACLSVAAKFNEASAPCLHEIQMEDLDHTFQSITIQRMELMLLQSLGWRLGSTTAYSYVQLLMMIMDDVLSTSHPQKDLLATRVTELLVGTLLDCEFVEYRASTAAASALWCGLEELVPSKSDTHLTFSAGFLNQDDKDILKCHDLLKEKLVNPLYSLVDYGKSSSYPSSPVTVLLTERIDVYDSQVDLSLFIKAPSSNTCIVESTKKRRKMETTQIKKTT